jgi:superfamily II DNA helicase RecQ
LGKKVRKVKVFLDSKGTKSLPFEEIKAILRGADVLIMSGGRSLLAKILRGSKDKKVLELNHDKCPVYGYFNDHTIEQITAKIDWLILNGYLDIEYDYRLPLLVFTEKGWQIEMDTRTDEFLKEFDEMIKKGQSNFDMTYLKDRNRKMIFKLLDKVQNTKDKRYIPILEAWKSIDSELLTPRNLKSHHFVHES